jgi:hypothetical protein
MNFELPGSIKPFELHDIYQKRVDLAENTHFDTLRLYGPFLLGVFSTSIGSIAEIIVRIIDSSNIIDSIFEIMSDESKFLSAILFVVSVVVFFIMSLISKCRANKKISQICKEYEDEYRIQFSGSQSKMRPLYRSQLKA